MAGKEKQDGKESSSSQLRAEAEKKVSRSAGKSAPLKEQDLDKLVHELRVHQVELEMQNDELRRAQEQIAKSRNDYADLYDSAPVGYLTFNHDALITGVNLTGAALLGVERPKLLKRRFRQIVAPADAERWDRHFVSVLHKGEKQSCDLLLRRGDGSTLHARLDSIRAEMDDGTRVVRTAMSDITERKILEAHLGKERQEFKLIVDTSPILIFYKDQEGRFVRVNKAFAEATGISEDEVLGKTVFDFYSAKIAQGMTNDDQEVLKLGRPKFNIMERYESPSGIRWVQTDKVPTLDENGVVIGLLGFTQDITDRKRAEASLRSEQMMLARTEGIAHIGSWEWDIATDIVNWSDELFRIFQRDPQEGAPSFADQPAFYHPEDFAVLRQAVEAAVADGTPYALELRAIRKDGKTRVCMARGVAEMGMGGRAVRLFGSLQDITERKQAEEMLRKSDARYRLLAEHTTDVIRLLDMDLKTTYLSPSAEKQRGFTLQEMVEMPLERQLTPESLRTASAILSEEIPRVESDPDYNPIFTLDLEYYCKDGTKVWTETKFSLVRNEKGKAVSILAEARDITERMKTEEKLVKSYENLQKTLNDAISTMVKIVELRDPYTAGHQQKVADLAAAIAREMELEDDRIDQLGMAALIHDIGKIYVPSDILSKPGKLTDIEFNLIKTHAQNGYDIVKGMDFQGIVAQAVLQHHERLDGSGYPNQLRGEDTLMEAKILAVADVIEAMASYRPYRPALGIDKALEEISRNRGKLYDPAVVDACLKLFNSGKFEFKSA